MATHLGLSYLGYRIFYKMIHRLLMIFRFLMPPKIKALIEDRQELNITWRVTPTADAEILWFHCASGEIEYIKPLLRKIRKEKPHYFLFLTFFSPSGKPMARNCVFKDLEADGYAPLPWDKFDVVQDFLNQLKPKALIISRTDLWPELLLQCHLRKIPSLLVAATFAPGSKKMSIGGRLFLKLTLPLLTKISVVSPKDQEMIQRDFLNLPTIVGGDPRYDQVDFRINTQAKQLPTNILNWAKNPIFIAGSTWPEDEKIVLSAFQKLVKTDKYNFNNQGKFNGTSNLKLLLVPHESDEKHLELLRGQLKDLQISFQLFSETQIEKRFTEIAPNTQVLIFDQKGFLLDLYRLASLAFIGGSFKKQVHSVMEAIGQGNLVLVGPFHQNNREAIEFQQIKIENYQMVQCVLNADEMAQQISIFFNHPTKDLKIHIQNAFTAKTKATESTYEIVDQTLRSI
jgi:3-deoxy-D-manno-octulosonic-acid transferase